MNCICNDKQKSNVVCYKCKNRFIHTLSRYDMMSKCPLHKNVINFNMPIYVCPNCKEIKNNIWGENSYSVNQLPESMI